MESNIVKMYANYWLRKHEIKDEEIQELIIEFANDIDMMLIKKEVENEKEN